MERPSPCAATKASAAGASVSRMVLSPTVQRPRRANPSAAACSIRARAAPSRLRGVIRLCARLEKGGAVERPRRAPDRGHQPMSHRPQQLPWACLGGEFAEQRIHRPKADHEVVAVVAVAQHGVESRQVRRVPLDHDTAPSQRGSDGYGIDSPRRRRGRQHRIGSRGGFWRGGGGAHGRSSLGGASPGGNATGAVRQPRGPFIASLDAVLLCS